LNENTNANVFEKIEENYPRSSEYAKAKVNVLDQVPQSYSYKGNPKLDQTKHITETQNHEFVDSNMIKLLSKVVHSMRKDMQSWIVLLCIFTSKQVLLGMWNYRMW
jgi:hypothetical protein